MSFQWWCSAQTAAWEWSWQAYPGVWLFIGLVALGYGALVRRTRSAGAAAAQAAAAMAPAAATAGTVRTDAAAGTARSGSPAAGAASGRGPGATGPARVASFTIGLLCLWSALDWPIGALGAGYLASVHMAQFLLIALIAPPLLLWGIPPAAFEPLRDGGAGVRLLRFATTPVVALIVFNVIVGATHTPAISDTLMATQLGSFAIDMTWLAGGLLFWWPVAAPAPEHPVFHDLLKIVYITGQAIFMTPVFVYLTFSAFPAYTTFELAPPVHGIEPLDDQRVAGLIMKVIGGFILMGAVTILFFRWAQRTGDDLSAG